MRNHVALGSLAVVLVLAQGAGAPSLPIAVGAEPAAGLPVATARPALKPGDIDVERSRVYVHVAKKKLGHEHAVEGRVKSGRLRLDGAKDAGTIEFDMASLTADGEEARKTVGLKGEVAAATREKVNETMRGLSVLDVENHPTATFVVASSRVESTEDGASVCTLVGRFTLRGETRDLKVRAALVPTEDGGRRLKGEFNLRQSDYGITPYRAFGVVGVADDLRIIGDLVVAGERTPEKK
ncbi:MAG: YceI family protein [Planctomycetaceae bacterium]